ncbi:tripartite motif-containing protein 75-like [Sorex fumeus]|uniref:tripartite motif-containing protein 75-like n=1 Tax=Sorex fumeus TaxID=62283 RepID=UPI0024AE41AE|nr:tripartite motif-containing protein 75-like [Sorex fumeus]
MESAGLAKMQAELICPVCLNYLNDPVTIECGHNFCDSCLQMSWKDLEDAFPCPVCRQSRQEKRIYANTQLRRLVELVHLLHSAGSSEATPGEEHRCKEHQQVLSLFCEEDRELLCSMCTQCPAHQGHEVRSVAEAATHHKQRLCGYIVPLKKRLAEMQKLAVNQDKKLLQLREEMGKQRRQLTSEFKQLSQLVEREQEAALLRLAEEEKRLQQQLDANLEALSDYVSSLKGLLGEVAERRVMSGEMVLRGARDLQQRCAGLEQPTLHPLHFRRPDYSLPPLCMTLSSIIQKFREHISLDPQTAHPSLRLSKDLRSVSYVRKRPKRGRKPQRWEESAAELAVLGREAFSRGRHYWEVQVGNKPEWAVGVCIDAPSGKEQRPPGGPRRRWTVQLQDEDYLAGAVPLTLKDKPTRLGVYLDYELGQLSFYNASDKSHIHSFMENFADVLKPYFCVGRDCTPLTVSAGGD